MVTEIKNETYGVEFNRSAAIVRCYGSLRLGGMEEYEPIVSLLDDVVTQQPSLLTMDLRELEFLNSSGINVLSKFVIRVRQQKTIALKIIGSQAIPWQGKSLKNLQRLMPSLELELLDMED